MPTPRIGQTHSLIHQQQPMNCLSVFDHFVGLALKGLRWKTSGNVLLQYLVQALCSIKDGALCDKKIGNAGNRC